MQLKQEITFCRSGDGVNIACGRSGSGPLIVRVGAWLSHLECDLREADASAEIAEFGKTHTLLRYDARGSGLSDRRIPPLSFDALVSDLEAVVDSSSKEPVVLYAVACGAPVAIAYAARHPKLVSKLVILNGYGRAYFSAAHTPPVLLEEAKLLIASAGHGWGTNKSVFGEVFLRQLLGSHGRPDARADFYVRMGLSMTAEMAQQFLRINYSMDVKAECALLQCPTLVFHARGAQMVGFEQGRKLAAWIPGARFIPLETDSQIISLREPAGEFFFKEIRAFLGAPTAQDAPRLTSRQGEILQLVAGGMTDKEIARAVGLSPRTVEMHMALAMRALGSANRAEAVHRAAAHGLLANDNSAWRHPANQVNGDEALMLTLSGVD